MLLKRVHVEGYRSIGKPITLHLDDHVTAILGANDHGKTNLLAAMLHLNPLNPFEAERDLNWDRADDPQSFPRIDYVLALDDDDKRKLGELIDKSATPSASQTAKKSAPPTSPDRAASETVPPPSEPSLQPEPSPESRTPENAEPDAAPAVDLEEKPLVVEIPNELTVSRVGIAGELTPSSPVVGVTDSVMAAFLKERLPRIELIPVQDKLPDSVAPAELGESSHEFMKGIFYYAGLDPAKDSASLFDQTDGSMMRLRIASLELNKTLKKDWTQGQELEFSLDHESKGGRILLRIQDPAVTARLVRASHRSSGFTHFFTLKTVLYARQKEHPANSYVFLFDDPGIFLHPLGQYDLLQALDTFGKHNQVVYTTHSIFLLNKNYPDRHRLLVKASDGTKLDGKPYVGRWGKAIEALGLSLAGTVLFAQHIALVEGDSDPILMNAVFQKLIALRQSSVDLNTFSAIATGSSTHTDALIGFLLEGAMSPRMYVLVDGDDAGARRLQDIQKILEVNGVTGEQLDAGTTIEDYLPLAGELYVKATADYVIGVLTTLKQAPAAPDELRDRFRVSFRERFEEGKPTTGLAAWAQSAGKELGGLPKAPSKVGIAREYAHQLLACPPQKFTAESVHRALDLLNRIRTVLQIPEIRDAPAKILQETAAPPRRKYLSA